MQTRHSIIRQDEEPIDSLEAVLLGKALLQRANSPGCISLEFKRENGISLATFIRISSVTYFHELLCSKSNYPYPEKVNFVSGLYECQGSSYLHRLQQDV